jgi:hypothetical protein
MASATYENILREVEHLTDEERRQLRDELNILVEHKPVGTGATFVAYLESLPFDDIDRFDVDLMEQAIEEGCERIEPTA